MFADIATLFWLQWKLNIAMFRSRRAFMLARVGRVVLMLFLLVMSLPFFVFTSIGLGYGTARISPRGGFELLVLVYAALLFFWLLLPATYNTDMIERFDMPRLFVHPIRTLSLVVGSTAISLISYLGLWTLLIVGGQVVGVSWHGLVYLPLVLLGGLVTLAILVLIGRLMEDVFDLVASDRRLRGALIFLLTLPLIGIFIGNYAIQIASHNYKDMDELLRPLLGNVPSLRSMGPMQGIDTLLTAIAPSRFLMWLPTSWAAAGMTMWAMGRPLQGALFLALAVGMVGVLLWAHSALTRRMMHGVALHMSTERVRRSGFELTIPGPPELQALFTKDWSYLRRSPVTRRVLLATPMVAFAFGFGLWQITTNVSSNSPLLRVLPLLAATLLSVSINLSMSNFTANYFGAVDREGLAGLILSAVDRRYVLLSGNLATLLLAMAQAIPLMLIVGIAGRSLEALLWGLYLSVCLHISTLPAYNFASIIGPYRAQMEFFGKNQGNLWTLLAWVVATPPVLIMVMLPYFFWKPGLPVGAALAAIYSLGIYLLTLKPLARLLDKRVPALLEAISSHE